MRKSSTYLTLLKVHKSNLDCIAGKIAIAREYLERENNNVRMLEGYLREYQDSFLEPSSSENLLSIQSKGSFIKKLYNMMETQEDKVKAIEKNIEDLNGAWVEENINVKKYEKLIELEKNNYIFKQGKEESKYSDEVNTNFGHRNLKKH